MDYRSHIRVLVADGHAVVAQGISRLLEDEPDMEVAACVSSGHEALEQAL